MLAEALKRQRPLVKIFRGELSFGAPIVSAKTVIPSVWPGDFRQILAKADFEP
jgi:hypothetical protein